MCMPTALLTAALAGSQIRRGSLAAPLAGGLPGCPSQPGASLAGRGPEVGGWSGRQE